MAPSLLVYVIVFMAVSTMSCTPQRGQNICYTTANYKKVVTEVKSRSWGWKTEYYKQTVTKIVPMREAGCCHGYRSAFNGECEPVCKPDCSPPKVCVAPNSCVCPSHLVEDSGGQCVERLCLNRECKHGTCNPKGFCVCKSGYRPQGDSQCVPECPGGCGTGGRCTAPKSCVCDPGFRKAPNHIGCEPVSCAKGYELKPNGTSGLRTCQPSCASGCPDGRCTAPNSCECDAGYHQAEAEDGLSTCVATLRCWTNGSQGCQCVAGYKLTLSDGGLLECRLDCGALCGPYTVCKGPGGCRCMKGYSDKRLFVEIERNDPLRCEPVCRHGCGEGRCVAPNKCQCSNPLKVRQIYTCVNARCHAPGACRCWPNYESVPGKANRCRPHCDPPCENGTCVAPGQCICLEGYELRIGRCRPKCKSNCGYGSCVAPDKCECWTGYELATDETGQVTCVPQCKPACVHGECTAPNNCKCWRGYRKNGSLCEPVCAQPCTNADCVEPDTCRCWDGFSPAPEDDTNSVCQPTCNTTCVNATCTAPNTCTCLEGLVRDSRDTTGAVCGVPCPLHLCSEELRGENGCLMAGEDQDCVCEKGRKRPLCSSEGRRTPASTGGKATWLLLFLLPPAVAAVALAAFLCVRNRRRKSATGNVPPQRLSPAASEPTSSKHSTSDEYDDVSGYFAADTKKLVKRVNERRVPNTEVARGQITDDADGLYEGVCGGRCSPVYGEIGDDNSSSHYSELKPNNANTGAGTKRVSPFASQMAENELYEEPSGKEWSRASVQVIDNNLYMPYDKQPERNTLTETDLDQMYAKVVKKGKKGYSAKLVDNDFYGQPSRNEQENTFGKVVESDVPLRALRQKQIAQEPEGHYEDVSDEFGRAAELREIRKDALAKQEEERDYEEIGDTRPEVLSEIVDNDLYKDSGSGVNAKSVRQEVEADYAEIDNRAGGSPGEIVENSLYAQTGGGGGGCSVGTEIIQNDLYSSNATDLEKNRYLHTKIMKRKGNKKS
ncbi:platelet endothelial aggregation receptor 1-like [Schistocerca serialis cubense]|uniref:platelet endothelial aggregation receptor 1-like n=1 Tax=Schistocerca serialis cubense TaxID=2023355 RepID=UPI00214F1D6D|nr:platelet endothelial aggregation receptor 1-like [Schistocerca serialis cubense]